MSNIPVGCRLNQATIGQFDKLASDRGTNRAGLLRSAIAKELGQVPPDDLAMVVARLGERVDRLENILLTVAGAILR